MVCTLKLSVSFWPIRRATMSLLAPGGKGTMMRIDLLGYACWAAAKPANAMSEAVNARATAVGKGFMNDYSCDFSGLKR